MQRLILLIALFIYCSKVCGQSSYVDSLLQIVALNKQDDDEMKALFTLANNCYRSDPDKAKKYLYRNLELAVPSDNFYRQCGAYSLLLTIYQQEGKTDSAAWCVNKFRTVAANAPSDNKVQLNYNQAIGLYYKKKGEFKTALPYLLAVAKYAETGTTDKAWIGGQWLNAGNLYNNLGDYNNAMTCHLKALRFFEEAGNKLGESFCYNSIAISYSKLKQYSKAAEYGQKSLALKKSLNDSRGICVSELELGEIYMSMGNNQQALKRFETALKMAREEKMLTEEATCYLNMAKIFAKDNKDSLAIIYFKKTRAIARQLDNKEFAANADAELATLNNNTENLKQTEAALVTSSNTFKESGSLNEEADNYKRLSDFYASTRQYDKALDYLTRYHSVKDSITGYNVQVQLKKLDEQYNSFKKEQEIAFLKKEKELQQQRLSRQNVLMIGSLVLALLALTGIWLLINRNKLKQRMKELELRNQIAADLHDEVGSSLSSIHMLSQMGTTNDTVTHQKNVLEKVSSNAKETMDRMSDIVWMIKPGETETGSLKQRMERFAIEICSSKNIELSVDLSAIDNIKFSMAQRKNIYLIFKEAMNNAVKYSGTKKIDVKAIIKNKQLELLVKDHGKGFDTSLSGRGNGLDNMKNRTKELNGKLDIISVQDGTTVNLAVPV